ncbi:RDD family protein [Caenimonas sp. SL110]|uniref:RDD family protein n=1 Tax=Caenimonas sp. SL110 TaxID=1450524 RepID=UPI0006543D26|nr:RDD family protein [Caenimonas sp. SL110]
MPLDTLYSAETPEGIALSLRPAGVVSRCLAYLVDFAVRLAIFFAIAMTAGAMGGMGTAFLLISYFALEWFYPVVFELARSGATPGKRLMGLQVVMDSGLPVTPAASIIRNLLRAADFLPAMYAGAAVSMLVRPDCKRLGDLAAGTLVVYAESVQLHGEVPQATPVAPARKLSPNEQVAILAWAGRAKRLTPERLEELAALAEPVLAQRNGTATTRLMSVAQWLLGRREGPAP